MPPPRIPIEQACEFLKYNLKEITSVKEWAEAMGRTRAHFTRRFKAVFGTTPSNKMAAMRKQKMEDLLLANAVYPAEILAEELGLSSANCLCQYLSRHFNITLRALRKQAQEQKWQHTRKHK